jgi:UV excision repair protein RAD23
LGLLHPAPAPAPGPTRARRARAGLPPGAVAVQLSEEEQAAVGRLEAMGFDRQAVLEAFLACDRNETMAANFLLENAGDDM